LLGHPVVRLSRANREYYEVAQMWRELVLTVPPSIDILRNAISFFLFENPTLASELLDQAERCFPGEGMWVLFRHEARARELAFPLLKGSLDEKVVRLGEIEQVLRLSDLPDHCKPLLHERASHLALEAGHLSRAQHHAERLLACSWDPGAHIGIGALRANSDIVHQCHVLLGRVALRLGNLDRAKAHLALALRVDPSPLLAVMGPNMALAKELLRHEEREAVLRYLASCRRLWDQPVLDLWEKQVRGGEVPDFGLNELTF
jgi:hypothetical protein